MSEKNSVGAVNAYSGCYYANEKIELLVKAF